MTRGLLAALVGSTFALACGSSGGSPTPDGLDALRARSEGPVWGRRGSDGRLVSLWWDVPADDLVPPGDGEPISPERAAIDALGLELGVAFPLEGTRVVATQPIGPDGTLTVFQLVHAGVDVAGAELRVVRVGDRIRYVHARVPPQIFLGVEPTVSAQDALAGLGEQLGEMMSPMTSTPRLRVWDSAMVTGAGGRPVLAWEVDVQGVGTAYLSATDGNLLQVFEGREHFTDVYFVRQSDDDLAATSPGGVREMWYSAGLGPLIMPPLAEPAASLFAAGGAAQGDLQALARYHEEAFGWRGIDGEGSKAPVLVGFSATCEGCPTAFWAGTDYTLRERGPSSFGEYFVFSTGSYGADVLAHEHTHAVLDYATRRDPVAFGAPLATEESLADTFAALFESSTGAGAPWVMGDALDPSLQRDLSAPAEGWPGCAETPSHVDEVGEPPLASVTCEALDAGECTEANGRICLGGRCYQRDGWGRCASAVGSLAAHRLVEGDRATGIEGLGAAKAEVLYFTALALVGAFEGLEDLRDHVLASCFLWAEAGADPPRAAAPITFEDCGDVINAFHSVGLGAAPDSDRDGWDDAVDNCPSQANPTQADADFDGVGDACAADGERDAAYHRCFWRDEDRCAFDNDPRELLRAECDGPDAVWGAGFCPGGGAACLDEREGRIIGEVFYDGDADANALREARCDGPTERWTSDYAPPGREG